MAQGDPNLNSIEKDSLIKLISQALKDIAKLKADFLRLSKEIQILKGT